MPRPLPLLSDDFAAAQSRLISFANRLEQNHIELTAPRSGLTLSGLELSYQLIYLKIFLLWEGYIEEIFYRLLCGYQSNGGIESLKPGVTFARSQDAARTSVLGARDYALWHNPNALINRSDNYFDSHNSYFRTVISSNSVRLQFFADVRHHIAHAQENARLKFDNATMSLAGRRYPSANAGRFLRDTTGTGGAKRWLEVMADEFQTIIRQFC